MLYEWLMRFTYVGIFLVLFATGFGLPIPEEAILVTAGFFVYKEYTLLWPTLVAGLLGVVLSDMTVYLIGRHWGTKVLGWKHLGKLVKPSRVEFVKEFFQRHGGKTIIMVRYMPGFRMPAYLAAGSTGMKLGRFLLLDVGASLVSIPLEVGFGYVFGGSIELAFRRLHHVEVVLVAVGLFILTWLVMREVFEIRK